MHWIDPDCLPEIKGRFERFLINPHGDADGLILLDGAEVHFPPHMAMEIVPAVENAPGAELRIRGVRPRQGDVFAAVSFELPNGARIEDRGPPDKHGHDKKPPKPRGHAEREEMLVASAVRRALHGPKGETRGVLLASGEIVRFPPHVAAAARRHLKPGAPFAARGKGMRTRLGAVVEAKAIGASPDDLHTIGELD